MTDRGSILLGGTIPLLMLFAAATPAVAQTDGDPVAGQQLAKTWCINCHVVSPGQTEGTSNGAPPFTAIAVQPGVTPMGLRVWLQTPHHRMPDLSLSNDQIDDVTAYILSLRSAPKP